MILKGVTVVLWVWPWRTRRLLAKLTLPLVICCALLWGGSGGRHLVKSVLERGLGCSSWMGVSGFANFLVTGEHFGAILWGGAVLAAIGFSLFRGSGPDPSSSAQSSAMGRIAPPPIICF
jgi:hypothetical protein